MLCITLSILIMTVYFVLLSCSCAYDLPDNTLSAFVLTCAQIVVSILLLGTFGQLHLAPLIVLNISISTVVLICAVYSFRSTRSLFLNFPSLHGSLFRSGVDIFNCILTALILVTYSWVAIAACHLPLRGVDDLFYHLPPVFEYIQTGRISLMPTEIRAQFSFPQNAELLFLWPTIFLRSQELLDAVNILFVMTSVLAVYLLLRVFTASNRDAAFLAMLYALVPVVILQAGSNYIDVIVSLFLIASLYYTVRFFRQGHTGHGLLAAVAIGLVCGMKYTAVFITFPLQVIIVWKLCGEHRRWVFGYVAVVLALCGWWYARNAIVFGNPFYPMNIFRSGLGVMDSSGASLFTADVLRNIGEWMMLFPGGDVGLGSYNGGYGLVFWGIGFPAWICVCIHAILDIRKTGFMKFLVLLQLPVGLGMLLLLPPYQVQFAGRLSLYVVAIGLLAIALAFEQIDDNVYKICLKCVCVGFSVLSCSLLAISTKPSYRFETSPMTSGNAHLPYEYLFPMDTEPEYTILRHTWNPLDYLTRDNSQGLACYVAANHAYFALAPFYGSKLQNRPVVFGDDTPANIDAFVYLHFPLRNKEGVLTKQEILYPNTAITELESLAHLDNTAITCTDFGSLIMTRAYMDNPDRKAKLRAYYGTFWPEAVEAAEQLKPHLDPAVPVISSNQVVYGLRYLELGEGRWGNIILVPEDYVQSVASVRKISKCYTLDTPLPGYSATEVVTVRIGDRRSSTATLFKQTGIMEIIC